MASNAFARAVQFWHCPQAIDDLTQECVARITSRGAPASRAACTNSAFVKCTAWVSLDEVVTKVEEYWGKDNATLVRDAYDLTRVRDLHGKG